MRRTPLVAVGMAPALLGTAALIWKSVGYTQRETPVDVGTVNITADPQKSVPRPPVLGGAMPAGGVVLIAVGARKP